MKENSTRFVLACTSLLLQPDLVNDGTQEKESWVGTYCTTIRTCHLQAPVLKTLWDYFINNRTIGFIILSLLSNGISTGHTVMKKIFIHFQFSLWALQSPIFSILVSTVKFHLVNLSIKTALYSEDGKEVYPLCYKKPLIFFIQKVKGIVTVIGIF